MGNSNDITSDGVTSVSQWEALIEHSSDIVTVLDDDGVIQFDSPAVERILGYHSGELVGENAFEYIHPDDRDQVVATFEEVVGSPGEVTEQVEYRFRHADGTWVWLETVGSNRKDTELDGYVLNSRDITAQKEREVKLRERAKELDALHRTTELFATQDDPVESLLAELVAELPAWFQYPERAEARISCGGVEVTSEAFDPEQQGIAAVATAEHGRTLRVEVSYQNAPQDSERVQFLPEERQLIKTVTTHLSETVARRRQQRELKLFKRAVEQAGYAVVITDSDGAIEYVNPAFEAQTGFTRAEVLGQNPRILKSGKHEQALYEQLWETVLSGEVWEAEVINRRKDGALYYTDQVISPITDDDGEITHFVAIESESTSRRIREQQLGVLNRILRHNLRNSLTVIESHATLLRDTLDDPEQERSIATIQNHVEKLAATSDKVATVRSLFQTEPRTDAVCDIATLLPGIEAAVREEHPDVNLTVTCPETVTVSADQRVVLALEEAVENAIVHNDSQPPAVSVVVTVPDGNESVEIEIVDDGPGLPEEQYARLGTTAETPREHGSGIGLWMIHWIVTTFGGEVSIEPRASRGTRVSLRLPAPGD